MINSEFRHDKTALDSYYFPEKRALPTKPLFNINQCGEFQMISFLLSNRAFAWFKLLTIALLIWGMSSMQVKAQDKLGDALYHVAAIYSFNPGGSRLYEEYKTKSIPLYKQYGRHQDHQFNVTDYGLGWKDNIYPLPMKVEHFYFESEAKYQAYLNDPRNQELDKIRERALNKYIEFSGNGHFLKENYHPKDREGLMYFTSFEFINPHKVDDLHSFQRYMKEQKVGENYGFQTVKRFTDIKQRVVIGTLPYEAPDVMRIYYLDPKHPKGFSTLIRQQEFRDWMDVRNGALKRYNSFIGEQQHFDEVFQ